MTAAAQQEPSLLSSQGDCYKLRILGYMGKKSKILVFLIPKLLASSKIGGTVLDLIAGPHYVGYALKPSRRVFTNDIQAFSQVMGQATIANLSITVSKKGGARGVISLTLQRIFMNE